MHFIYMKGFCTIHLLLWYNGGQWVIVIGLVLWCLTSRSTIFQLCRGDEKLAQKIKLYRFEKNTFHFPIVNFPFRFINIPAAPAHWVYISQLIKCLLKAFPWNWVATNEEANQPMVPCDLVQVITSKNLDRQNDFITCYGIYVQQMTRDMSICHNHNPVVSSFMTYHSVSNRNNTMVATIGAGNVIGLH
jgi:hypothetical protein